MPLSADDLRAIAASGGGMTLNARNFDLAELRGIASSANSGGGQITLRNVDHLDVIELRAIAASGGGRVVFDFLG